MVDRATLERDPAFERRGCACAAVAPVVALPGETCRLVATRLAVHGLERLPVVADQETRRLVGIVSRSDLVKPSLAHFDEEHKKERFRRIRPQGIENALFAYGPQRVSCTRTSAEVDPERIA